MESVTYKCSCGGGKKYKAENVPAVCPVCHGQGKLLDKKTGAREGRATWVHAGGHLVMTGGAHAHTTRAGRMAAMVRNGAWGR